MEICREQERVGLWKQAACDKLGYCVYAVYLTAQQPPQSYSSCVCMCSTVDAAYMI